MRESFRGELGKIKAKAIGTIMVTCLPVVSFIKNFCRRGINKPKCVLSDTVCWEWLEYCWFLFNALGNKGWKLKKLLGYKGK